MIVVGIANLLSPAPYTMLSILFRSSVSILASLWLHLLMNSINESTADIISTVALTLFPLHALWSVELPPRERRLILSLFCCTLAIAAVSVAHIYYSFGDDNVLYSLTGHLDVSPLYRSLVSQVIRCFQIAVSLLTCNLLVVVPRIYRLIFPQSDDDSDYESSSGDCTITTRQRMEQVHSRTGASQSLVLTQLSSLPYTFTESRHADTSFSF